MKKIILAPFFTLLIGAVAHTASLYILYDPACMDRLEYVALNGNDQSEYIVYHVNTNPGVKVVLEVGNESTAPSQDFQPAQVIRCNNAMFDEKLVNAINSNIDKVFMVVRRGNNQYYVSPIAFAARYLRSEDYILYDSPKYRFLFDTRLGAIGENIAYKNPNTEVYFEGMLENECSGTLLFRQKAEFAGNPHSNIELIPEVGIVEERSGINATDAMRNVLRLQKVNGKKLARYLRQLCQGIDTPEEEENAASTQPVQPTDEFLSPGPRVEAVAARGGADLAETLPPGQPAPNAAELHEVKKGETLYRISKKYNVSVEQLKAWNSKGNSNTIYVGEKLRVSPPATERAAPVEGQAQALGGPLGFEKTTPAPAPAPSAAAQPSTLYSRGAGGGQEADYHYVKRGETIASIAMNYGYTEQRFREFNNLRKNDVAMIGMALKTSDCECPTGQPAPSYGATPAPMEPEYVPRSFDAGQPRITTRYYQPGFSQQQAEGATSRRTTEKSSSSQEEAFYEDQFSPNRTNSGQEYQHLNTPLFLDRTSTPPPAGASTAPSGQAAPNTNTSRGREYSPEGDFYSITGNRIENAGNGGGSANTARKSTGLISGSISSRSPLAGGAVQEYSNTGPRTTAPKERSFYVVKEGDTLFRIARMYGMSVERLREINNLGANEVIIPYQKIYLN